MHDDSLYDVAGDPRMARLLRSNLRRLAEGPPGPLREMAEAVLRGHLYLRQAALSDAYGAELGSSFQRFWSEYVAMDPAERDHLVDRTRGYLDRLVAEDDPVTGSGEVGGTAAHGLLAR